MSGIKTLFGLRQLADRLVLQPSTNPIHAGDLERQVIPADRGDKLEMYTTRLKNPEADALPLLLIKFPGTGGRAEYSSARPAEHWTGADTVVWTVNPFGYGQSSGRATMKRFPEMVHAVADAAIQQFPKRRLAVYGNSLGSISALYLAANYDVAGVYLRNPVPIHQMISRRPRYAWPSLGASRLLARQIPRELDAVENAKRCKRPCLVISSQRDRVVPVRFQNEVIAAYAGSKLVVSVPRAGHQDGVPSHMQGDYAQAVQWLGHAMGASCDPDASVKQRTPARPAVNGQHRPDRSRLARRA